MTSSGNSGIIEVLPNIDSAVIPDAKIFKYALVDKDKAKAFELALGYNLSNGTKLIENIRNNLACNKATYKRTNQYGDVYEVKMKLKGENGKSAIVTTGWIVDDENGETRLTTLYVDKKKKG